MIKYIIIITGITGVLLLFNCDEQILKIYPQNSRGLL